MIGWKSKKKKQAEASKCFYDEKKLDLSKFQSENIRNKEWISSVDKFKEYTENRFEKMLYELRFVEEFQKIPELDRLKAEKANFPENAPLNRYNDVYPSDDCLIPMTPSDENPLGYINTSAMKLENSPLKFYASQGPLENTTIDFWAMIYKCKIPTIIMLTNYCELGVQKCHEYLPKTKLKILDGVYIVFDEVKKNVDTMTITKLHFEFKNTRRNITHIVFKKWEDKEVPSNEDFNIIINEVRSLVQKSSIKKICVHCSAGAGRTGVLICILYVLMVQIPNEFINIDGTIADMRLCRSQMVQTSQQYRFIHLFIIQRLDELID